jgi:hypothetical protein
VLVIQFNEGHFIQEIRTHVADVVTLGNGNTPTNAFAFTCSDREGQKCSLLADSGKHIFALLWLTLQTKLKIEIQQIKTVDP